MQPIQFFAAVERLAALFSAETKGILFGSEVMLHMGRESSRAIKIESWVVKILHAAHEVTRLQPQIVADPEIMLVLNAFGIEELIDPVWPIQLSTAAISSEGDRSEGIPQLHHMLSNLGGRWNLLHAAADPLKRLLIPPTIANEKPFDEILTVEIRSETDVTSASENITAMLGDLNHIYATVAKAMSISNAQPLTMIYAASGTSFRFDFKGLAEVIKEMKDLLVELWKRIRFRRAEEQQENNKTVLQNLKIIEVIAEQERNHTITGEEGAMLREAILRSTQSLFDTGAVPREIPKMEVIQNQVLLEARQPKLLGTQVLNPETPKSPIPAKPPRAPRRKVIRKPKGLDERSTL